MSFAMLNSSFVFSLSGFENTMNQRVQLFFLSLLCYFVILLLNLSLIFTIIVDKHLHEPMYIFMCNLCINALYGTAGFYPKFLFDLLSSTHLISYYECLVQVFIIYSYTAGDFSILALMAYDRYIAICRPLEYHSIMTKEKVAGLVCLSWVVPLCLEVVVILMTSMLQLCGSHIDKPYCANWSIVKLACTSTTSNNVVGLITIFFYFCHYMFIICTYVTVINKCLRSLEGKKKFLQTCLPHLLCLQNVSIALLFDLFYARYGTQSIPQNLRTFMAVQFLAFPPILNPLIYGLNLSKVRSRIRGFLKIK